MKKVLLVAPMASVLYFFCRPNIAVLKKMGYEIHVATNFYMNAASGVQYGTNFFNYIKECGVVIHEISFERASLVKNIKAYKQLRKLLRNEKFDMIHSHTETGGLITMLATPRSKSIKKVYTPHGMSFYKGSSVKTWLMYYPIEKIICASMDANIAINQEELDVLKKWNANSAMYTHGVGLDVSKIKKMAVERNEKRASLGIPADCKLILSVGELNANKNHIAILKAMKDLDKNVFCLICGDGGLREELEKFCINNNIADRVVLAGRRTDIYEIVHIADVFVFPSFHEGLPVSVMEAMAAGLPVVCSKIRGNTDLIVDGEGGYMCAPSDYANITKSIKTILDDDSLRERMGRTNAENINNFSAEMVEKDISLIYHNLIK